jgi:hypothetical protein
MYNMIIMVRLDEIVLITILKRIIILYKTNITITQKITKQTEVVMCSESIFLEEQTMQIEIFTIDDLFSEYSIMNNFDSIEDIFTEPMQLFASALDETEKYILQHNIKNDRLFTLGCNLFEYLVDTLNLHD